MKVLYGSQNFGFNTPSSDRDFMEIVFPTWDDVLKNRMISTTTKNDDGSLTKVVDIRVFLKNLIKGGFSDIQTLYAVEYIDDCDKSLEDFKWFIDNRDRIIRVSPWDMYITNLGCMRTMYNPKKGLSPKDLLHLYVFFDLTELIASNKKFKIHNGKYLNYRYFTESLSEAELMAAANEIMQKMNDLESHFIKFKDIRDEKLIKEMESTRT